VYGIVAAVALATFVVTGGVVDTTPLVQGVVLAVVLLLVGRKLAKKVRSMGDASAWDDVELGALVAVAVVGVVLRVDGRLDGPLHPLAYVAVALAAAFFRPGATVLVALWLVGLEAAVAFVSLGRISVEAVAQRGFFVLLFALLHLVLLRAELTRIRAAARAKVEDEIVRLKDDARRYRLLGAGEAAAPAEPGPASSGAPEDRLARSSVEEIHQSVHYALELLRRTLDLHTAVLLWQNDAGTHLRISELSTASDDIHDAPIPLGDGVLAAVMQQKKTVSLERLKPSFKVPYYSGACPVRTFVAIPVMEDGVPRGILALDRTSERPFTPHEEELAAQAVRYCHRAIQNERVFVQLERAKVEQGKLYRAAQALGAALTEDEVLGAGVRAAREIASFDLAAVTVWDDEKKMHEVRAATSRGKEIDDLVGARFQPNAGLVSMVVQNKFPLPYRGDYDPSHQTVLTKRLPWPKMPSLLVIPLMLHDRVLGTLILGASRRHAFGESVRPTLEVLASHLAVSLANARMVAKLETMATTDGMTGLLNKRAMLEQAEQKVSSAKRFGRKLSVLVTDIDFFKRVNDTYGHDIGDMVIRGLGDVLRRQKRATDVVARFGGEEFVVLCEQTDEAGAMLLGERIREELEKTVFHTPNGKLSVTCSIGIATLPDAGGDWDTLFKSADEALYTSKRGGRNRTTLFQKRGSEVRMHAQTPAPPAKRAI
jgi:diguanylate cyclase (GGDEF)-like protein